MILIDLEGQITNVYQGPNLSNRIGGHFLKQHRYPQLLNFLKILLGRSRSHRSRINCLLEAGGTKNVYGST
jgi:hypothetical protein